MKQFAKENLVLILAVSILIVGILMVLAMPYMLTQWTFGVPFDQRTGAIGDTIGGSTAPVIGLLSAFLVFLSFYVQYKFNRQQNVRIEEIESRESEKVAINSIATLSHFINEFTYNTNMGEYPRQAHGAQGWFVMLDELEAIVYERWDKSPEMRENYWTEIWDSAYLLKLYGLFAVAINRVECLSEESRSRMSVLLRSEVLLLSKFVARMSKINSRNSEFQSFLGNFLLLLNSIKESDGNATS